MIRPVRRVQVRIRRTSQVLCDLEYTDQERATAGPEPSPSKAPHGVCNVEER